MELEFKEEFIQRYKKLLGEDYDDFIEYSQKYINKAIRVNTLKISIKELKERLEDTWELTPVPWCKEGFWIKHRTEERYDIGNLPEHQLGYIYVQDPASMIPPVVLEPKPGELVLDVCAAPGSKSSQMAQYMENEGFLISNDANGKRLAALGINLQRLGIHNALITRMYGNQIKGEFDKILLDAPCSGTGTIRRNYKIAKMYHFGAIKSMQNTQLGLIRHCFKLLKKGGTLVYSTCTLEPEENEEVVSKLLQENEDADLQDINLDINKTKPILEFEGKKYDPRVDKCLRINPQDNDTEGFFVAKIVKK